MFEFSYFNDMETISKNIITKPEIIEERLLCTKCKELLYNPVQSNCGCRFCELCYDNDSIICQYCHEQLENNKINDNAIMKEINQFVVGITYKELKNEIDANKKLKNENNSLKIENKQLIKVNDELNTVIGNLEVENEAIKSENIISKLIFKEENRKLKEEILNLNHKPIQINNFLLQNKDEVIWTIFNIKSYLNKDNSDVIFSKSFYTAKPGYKMNLKLYLKGDGSGLDKYLSLFFVINKGDYDNEISWPFKNSVKFEIIPLYDNKTFEQTLKSEESLSSFQKPISKLNAGVGQPKFLKLDLLKNDKYLQNGSLIIRFVVLS